jgi:hypothetical protein
MDKNVLDFIIIGAQKAGTTSLFRYLEPHPQIYMPPGKEAPYFSSDETFSRGWEWYLREYFGDAPVDRLWGKATPDYMAEPRVVERIKNTLPDVKLIALLRNPAERAYSQYLMALRNGCEARSFEEAVIDLLKPDALEEARNRPTPSNGYIVRGEYYRILTAFYGLFPSQQIAVYFTEELKRDPKQVLKTVFQFLGVSCDFAPPNLGTIYHKGGTERRLPWLEDLVKLDIVRSICRRIVPGEYRRPLAHWFLFQWNIVPDKGDRQIQPSVQKLLAGHYKDDVRQLSALLGKESPWSVEG